jgi:transcriptional regulator with XRE-family HTH domain
VRAAAREFFRFLKACANRNHYGIYAQRVPGEFQVPLKIDPAMPAKKTPKTSFGQRLFALRTARGYTQVGLAKALGATQRVISYYETKGALPTPEFLVALVRTLGVSADELLGIKPPKLATEELGKRKLWKRFKLMAALPERDQRAVIRLISSLSASKEQSQAAD